MRNREPGRGQTLVESISAARLALTRRRRLDSEADSFDAEADRAVASHVVAFAGAVAVALASLTVWLRAGLGTAERSFSGLDLTLLAIPVLGAAGVAAVAAVVGGATTNPALRAAASVAGAVVVVLSALVIVVVETVAAVIPDGILPELAREYAVDLSAGPGPWIALMGGLAMVAGARGWRPPFVSSLAHGAGDRRPYRALPAAMLLLSTALFAWLRYEPWLGASAAGSYDELTGWSLPWIGPLSLMALILLGAAVAAAALLQLQLAGLLAAAGGWLVTFVTGIVAQAASTIAKLRLDDIAPVKVREYTPQVELASATWVAFGTGLLAAAAGAGLLILSAANEDSSWAPS